MKQICLLMLMGLASRGNGQTFTPSIDFSNKVINSFSQGFEQVNGKGIDLNCASIAVVKCAIATYGPGGAVSTAVSPDHLLYTITLHNHTVVTLTAVELADAKLKSGFALLPQGDKAVYDEAVFLYAILAKRAPAFATSKVFTTCKDFESSLTYLRAGVNADNLPQLLGLRPVDVPQNSKIAWVYGNAFHAVFASLNIFDDNGVRRRINFVNWAKHISLRPARLVGDLKKTNFVLSDQH